MLRKWCAIAAALLVCLPIGGGSHYALANYATKVAPNGLTGHFWLGPGQLAAVCGCLLVLAFLIGQKRN